MSDSPIIVTSESSRSLTAGRTDTSDDGSGVSSVNSAVSKILYDDSDHREEFDPDLPTEFKLPIQSPILAGGIVESAAKIDDEAKSEENEDNS